MTLFGYRVGPLLKRTGREVMDDNILGLGAQTAYYFFFSLFPIFLFLAPMLALVGDKRATFTWLLEKLQGTVPAEAFALVTGVVESVVFAENAPGLVSIGAVLALWTGSNVFNTLIDALNQAYDIEKDERPWWKKRIIAILCLLGIGASFVVASVVMIAGGDIVNAAADAIGIGAVGRIVWTVTQYAIAFALLIGTAWAVYYYLPCVNQRKSHALAGAVATTIIWLAATMAFRLYVQNFGNYNATYGTIGGVIVLLTWMYLSMVILLTGGELASELHKGTGALRTRAGHLYNGRISDGRPAAAPSVERIEPTRPDERGGLGGPLAPAR